MVKNEESGQNSAAEGGNDAEIEKKPVVLDEKQKILRLIKEKREANTRQLTSKEVEFFAKVKDAKDAAAAASADASKENLFGRKRLLESLKGVYRFGFKEGEVRSLPANMQKMASLDMAPISELHKIARDTVVRKFQRFEGDTGSSLVQVALLTFRIDYLVGHFKVNRKDKHSKFGLDQMIQQRRKLMLYMRKHEQEDYIRALNELNLRPLQRAQPPRGAVKFSFNE